MSRQLPVAGLFRLTWIFSLISGLLVSIFLLAVDRVPGEAILRFVETFAFTALCSVVNLGLFLFSTKYTRNGAAFSRYAFYITSYLGAFVVWLLVRSLYSLITGQPWEGEGPNESSAYLLALLATWCFNTLILVVQNLVIIQHNKALAEIENLQLRASMADTSNLLLRQQIHPHFLFNALTTLKSLYKQDVQQGEEYLVHLANFLRASVSHHTTQTTLVKHEIAFCLDYLQMQKIRFGQAMEYEIQITDTAMNQKLLPYFSLQPLVENALKHNELTEERPVIISILEKDGYIVVSNNLQKVRHKEPSTGNGLHNLAERYRLLAKEEMKIADDGKTFAVHLKLLDQ